MSDITQEAAREIADAIDMGLDEFFRVDADDKVKIIREYLDAQIGTEEKAEVKSINIPGVPFEVSGSMLEKASDMILDAVAKVLVDKFWPDTPE